jgi:hypothetical protein
LRLRRSDHDKRHFNAYLHNYTGISEMCFNIIVLYKFWSVIPVAARSEARALIARTVDREFESRLRHGCLSLSFYVVLSCAGRGLTTGCSLVQGVLPHVEIN